MRLDADSARRCWEPIWLRRDFVGRIPDLAWWSAYGREGNGCGRAFVGVWKGAFGAGAPGWAVPLRYDVIRCWTGWFYAYFGRGISLNCA
ncbi:hypothetical protein HBI16_112540 [Parastagonospora nodorum]|nr:hypothetical protein HBI16_112540 [Parastagonospora nodorum]KAH6042202.1 hypothetical protein HBI54_133620 [Parastagonospora nodorum]KAH6192748.1 hypothetical protein HBI53_204880 [Parastagonospora nodorum]KAH6223947.1 hypothetical protein HBI43_078540 [Parastagonospora nodorum]KAH6552856.1 hypothetical protein HBI07_019420 [Parastagonospora nodorum]